MTASLAPALVALALAVPAAAAPALAVSGELPCTPDELRAALALRVGDVAVTVHGVGDRVRVEVGGRDRVVALDGARGVAAARRIALVAEDLAMPELPAGAPAVEALAPARPRHGRATLALGGRVSTEAMPRGAITAGVELGGGAVRLAAELGLSVGAAERAWLVGVPVRAGVALAGTPELVVSAVAMPFEVLGGRGDRAVIAGGGVEVRGRRRAGGVDVVYRLGLDAYVNQVAYTWVGAPTFATPRVELWGGLGVAWGRP